MSDSTSIALVTGANRGIGLAIAQSLKAAGHRVVITYRSGTPPEGFDAVQMDVTDSASVDAGFEKIESEIGIPEIIVANAGITKDTLVMRMSDEDFESVINANLTGAFRVSKRATKGLLKLKRGRLIFIGSVVGGVGAAGQVNYSASKSGLVGMARSFARELGSRGITANVIAPGFVETDMTSYLQDGNSADKYKSLIPLGRFAAAEDIANVCLFLASDMGSYVTGQTISACGGMNI